MRGVSLRSLIGCAGTAAAMLAASSVARAASIDLDTLHLLPDSTGQQVQVYVGGGEATQGVGLSVFVADGSADSQVSIAARKISNVDLFTESSVFSINNAGYVEIAPISARNSSAAESQFVPVTTSVPSAPVTLDTPISASPSPVTTTLDDASFSAGTFSTRGLENAASPTRYRALVTGGGALPGATIGDFSPSVSGSDLTLIPVGVPEPATLGLLGILVPAMLIRRRRATI